MFGKKNGGPPKTSPEELSEQDRVRFPLGARFLLVTLLLLLLALGLMFFFSYPYIWNDGVPRMDLVRVYYIAIDSLLLSLFFSLLFGIRVSQPFRSMRNAAERVQNGDYHIELPPRGGWELRDLAFSFERMATAVERIQKYSNHDEVDLARQRRLPQTGARRRVTLCYTTVRGFNRMMDRSQGEEALEMANTIISAVVPCVKAGYGLVDKLLTNQGVTIMSEWGGGETSGSVAEDALNCVSSCLMMRSVLRSLNIERSRLDVLSSGRFWNGLDWYDPGPQAIPGGRQSVGHLPMLRIGCVIHSGEVLAGFMGWEERKDYTVVGETADMAYRMASLNDRFDTDILITEDTYKLIEEKIIATSIGRGLYAVINARKRETVERIMQDLEAMSASIADSGRVCLGKRGPRTVEEVRESWRALPF